MFGMGADGAGYSKCHHGVRYVPGKIELDCSYCREEKAAEKARRDAEYERQAAVKKAEDEANCTPLVEADWVNMVEDYDHETGRDEVWVTRDEFIAGFSNPKQPVFDKRTGQVKTSKGCGGMPHDWR